MTTTIHERSAIQRELEITVDEAELQTAFDEAYKTMRSRVALPGFRPGKAPISMVKKLHGDAIEGDALERLAQEKFREAVEELKIEPIGAPVMTDLHRHAGEGAHFHIMYEIAPTIELQDMSGIEIETREYPVGDEDVTRAIDRLRFRRAERIPVAKIETEQTIAKLSFMMVNAAEGQPRSASEDEIYLAEHDILPELKQALIGKEVGETLTIDLPTQHRDHSGPHDHTPEPAEITILGAERVELPELTEDLIKDLSGGKAATELELRQDVRKELTEARDRAAKEDVEERIVAKMLELHQFEVPLTIVRAILDQMLEERQQMNVQRNFPPNYGIDEEEFRERNRPIAEARGKWVLLRDKLVESEAIEATDEDFEKLAEEEAAKYGLPKENLLKYYHKQDSIKNRIVSDKLGNRLREMVKLVEKPVEVAA
ncbi:MAG: trigger factor [Bacteroidota bacterium]|nr:trigger factor [Bacteroidota bacterium]MDP4233171.1 trigger factor [Bacteroidota bacterium]MDP4241684.1 trigger factor [Bacteroidota bacterium]MDP4287342.1 trigger factor [Bacteroidota bacterium]